MINPEQLTQADIGRAVIYRQQQIGTLTSWNRKYIFVRFLGPTGEACYPQDVSFYD